MSAPMGQSLPHDSAPLHVTGRARYADDLPAPKGTLHLAFGLSGVAHGTITSLDLSAVRAAPGVVAVLTADDLPFENDVSPSNHDEPLLATGSVHYVGQPIFLVVATSHRAARVAARKGKVEVSPLLALLTVDEAMAANSLFEGGPVTWQKGDAASALARSPLVVEGRFDLGGQEHFYLEGQAALALPQDAGMVVHCSTQHPTEIQHKVAEALGLPMSAVRVEMRRMGGGFGGKESQGNALAVACAVAARVTGRACKMRYDRDDDMVITGKRHDVRILYRAGVDPATGRLLGLEVTHLVRCGWSQDLSLPVADRAMLHADNAYHLTDVRIESHRLRTNTQSATAFRGFGGPQGIAGIERIMDQIAHRLGMDPVAVRRANYYADVGSGAPPETTPYGMEVTDGIIEALTDRLVRTSRYEERRAEIARWNAASPVLKRGIALTPVKFGISFTLTHLNQAGALVHVYQDGSVHLNHGGTEMGQGLHQKVAQVVAGVFGIRADQVAITATDTGKVPNTSATAASSGTDLNGMAAERAATAIRDRMAAHLAALHQTDAASVRFADGEVAVGAERLPFGRAAMTCYEGRVSLSATGFYATPDISWDRKAGRGRPFYYFAYGAAVSEVVIDTLTGENRILSADILHDAGQSLNPALDIGQIEGGYVQGAGWLTTEELVWDAKGRLMTHAPSTYKIPACSDRPERLDITLWDGPNRVATVYRSKAVGEPPFMHGLSAFLALSDACASVGPHYPDLQAPATAEAVLAAVARARGEAVAADLRPVLPAPGGR